MLSNSNRKERKILLQILLQYKAIIVEHHSSPVKLTKGKDIIYMTNVSFFLAVNNHRPLAKMDSTRFSVVYA